MDGRNLCCLASDLHQKLVYLAVQRDTYPDYHSALSGELSVVRVLARILQVFERACFIFQFADGNVDFATSDGYIVRSDELENARNESCVD
jgi:hypothetical protein